ncbi:MAG: hypothetical protein AB4352_01430 [Hormoscilla sp.]
MVDYINYKQGLGDYIEAIELKFLFGGSLPVTGLSPEAVIPCWITGDCHGNRRHRQAAARLSVILSLAARGALAGRREKI